MILKALKLLLPALIPSWNFFDVIAPSPRIQYALLNTENEIQLEWLEFRPRPMRLNVIQILHRIFWNPRWNETLYMVSCAERIMENSANCLHSENEILNRISSDLIEENPPNHTISETHLQFRLLTLQRQDSELIQEVIFHSRIQKLPDMSLQSGDDI